MSANGGAAKRISFGQGRYSTPVWWPRGGSDYIHPPEGRRRFGISAMKPDGSTANASSPEGYHNEGPTFAPNGLFLMFFFRDPGGTIRARGSTWRTFSGHGEFPVLPAPGYADGTRRWGPLMATERTRRCKPLAFDAAPGSVGSARGRKPMPMSLSFIFMATRPGSLPRMRARGSRKALELGVTGNIDFKDIGLPSAVLK